MNLNWSIAATQLHKNTHSTHFHHSLGTQWLAECTTQRVDYSFDKRVRDEKCSRCIVFCDGAYCLQNRRFFFFRLASLIKPSIVLKWCSFASCLFQRTRRVLIKIGEMQTDRDNSLSHRSTTFRTLGALFRRGGGGGGGGGC